MLKNIPPVTRNLLIINLIVYLLSNFVLNEAWAFEYLAGYFPLSPLFKIWQPITHMFMHAGISTPGGITHILFNMITLYSFGPVLEHTLGFRKYAGLYFLAGLGGFFLYNLINYIEFQNYMQSLNIAGYSPGLFFQNVRLMLAGKGDPNAFQSWPEITGEALKIITTPMVGASGAIFGVMAAFTTFYPNAKLIFLFIPFPIKAKYILPGILLVSVVLGYTGGMAGIAHTAHIGGALVGFILALLWKKKMLIHS